MIHLQLSLLEIIYPRYILNQEQEQGQNYKVFLIKDN